MKKKNRRWNSFWILAFGFLASALLTGLFYSYLHAQSVKNIERIRTTYAERTENLVNSIFHKTDVLAAIVKMQNGNITKEVFDEAAAIVYSENSGIRGIQYMPGAVVTYSYPVEGNEAVMGRNFLEIPERRDDCLLAINTKSIALSGPYHLIQGGLGLVARNPVFLKDSAGKEYFWGFSAIVLDLPDALQSAGLGRLPESGYDFQLFSVNENNERIVIAGNPKLNIDHAVCGTIQVPHHEWTLALVDLYAWRDTVRACALLLLCVVISLILWRLDCTMQEERAATNARNAFFSNISHDMRTPLNAIIGFSGLARMPGLTAEEKDVYLEKIQSSGNLMLDLVNDTLTISKAGSGKLQLYPIPVDTEELGRSIVGPVREMADRKNIHFELDKTAYRPRVILADRLNLQKIFLNLLNNAIKFTPSGGHVWVTVKDDPAGSADPDLVFTIRDDGIGMSRDFMDRMFEPFAQELQKGYEGVGTGLGLAIVKQITDLMKGTVTVESSPGKGTLFTLRFHFPEAAEDAVRPVAAPAPGPDLSGLSGKRVLLCEDNEINREVACAMLDNAGMETECAVNGKDGVEHFLSHEAGYFSLILMDIRMPVMDGYEAAGRIRSLDREDARTIPIVAMTADAFSEDIRKCMDAGMNAHIAKPVIAEKLYGTMTALLKE
jgi:signal transduction histidine kinase/CheY-like chemotaxis protein